MDTFEKFNADHFSVDATKTIITKTNRGWKTAYGATPILCDDVNRGVKHFEFKMVSGASLFIGIDEGRRNTETDFGMTGTFHYGLWGKNGKLYGKGTVDRLP